MRKQFMLLDIWFNVDGYYGDKKQNYIGAIVVDKNKKELWLNIKMPDDTKISLPLMPIKTHLKSCFKYMEERE